MPGPFGTQACDAPGPALSARAREGALTQDADFPKRLAETAEAVGELLDRLLSAEPGPHEIARPERLVAAMRYASLGGGKRLRPFLVVESATLFGVPREGALRPAAALECIHCYSLVHDDLPAMDDDDLRRGRPTVHVAFDEATAILAGDALLTYAFEILTEPATHPDPAIRAELALSLARAAGLAGMAGGQMLDLEAERRTGLNEEDIRRLQSMKTGALIVHACEAGAILGRADPEARDALLRYGRAVGAAFQIADDLLDVESTPEETGKATGKDRDANKATLVGLLGVEAARARLQALVQEAEAALAPFGARARRLAETARFTASRRA